MHSVVYRWSKKVLRALGGRPVNHVVGKWMPASATPCELVIVARFIFGRGHVANRFEQSPGVEPIDPRERREFNRLEMAPRSLALDGLRLEEADEPLGQFIIVESPRLPTDGLIPASDKRSV